jgi:hypothetical protein
VLDGHITDIRIVPLRVIGEGSETAPPPDRMERSPADPQSFSGKLWLMESGSFQVRMTIDGAQGQSELAVPVAAFAQRSLRMQKTTGAILALLMALLVSSFIAIFGAATRESQIEPGAVVPASKRTRGRIAMVSAAVAIVAILFLGNMWWTSVADANARDMVYKAPPLQVSLGGDQLKLQMGSSYWHDRRREMQVNKIIPDHGHMMHLFLIRLPDMDQFYHLHPEETAAETFTQAMPGESGGAFAVFADIVRESGFPDTMTATVELPARDKAMPLTGDDSQAVAGKISAANWNSKTAPLRDGAHVEWIVDSIGLRSQKPTLLRFRVLDKNGAAATDLEPYMGMAGHLVIVRGDLSVFAHVHPAGSVPMAALMLLQKPAVAGTASDAATTADPMAGMHHEASSPTATSKPEAMASEITFPYGFPQPGDYRLFLQLKRASHVETAVFDARIAP